ncbi:hypothetical protein ACFSUS_11140 [Spirosoma soli]|uniref:Uncharacterized protein n=1 Tax=Spirosoma soli TaxID=1770529 RepID=A0ABW5M500_9BACT
MVINYFLLYAHERAIDEMNVILHTLKSRNAILYNFGWICFVSFFVCTLLSLTTTVQVLGINAFIKPMKFFLSTGIFCWTMGWFTHLLDRKRAVVVYSWMVVIAMMYELPVVTYQAALGKLSHFNISSLVDAILFQTMGIVIFIFTMWTAYIGYLFFSQKRFDAPMAYVWGIRLGIVLFVIFAFEGFLMGGRLSHTVGAPDGGAGLPVTNWSVRHGDLRVAHFLGMHALQLLPLFSYYVARKPSQVIIAAALYWVIVSTVLVQALMGKPLLFGFGG